jgi:hypothetical protein
LPKKKDPAAVKLRRKGGKEIAKRGSEYFSQLQAKQLNARSARVVGLLPSPTFWGQFLGKALTGLCLFVSLVLMNESQVRKARKQLLGELPDLAEIVRGSLLDRRIFHRRGCLKCRRGEGHRVWVLTVGYPGGRTRQFTVPAQHKGQVQRWVRNYRRLRAKLEAICELNHELLRADP